METTIQPSCACGLADCAVAGFLPRLTHGLVAEDAMVVLEKRTKLPNILRISSSNHTIKYERQELTVVCLWIS